MPSTALKSFVRAFRNASAISTTSTSLPSFLIPAYTKARLELAWQHQKRTGAHDRQFASFNSPKLPTSDSAKHQSENIQPQDDGVRLLLSSRRQSKPEAWEALLDRHLPHALRMHGTAPIPEARIDHPLPIKGVASVLAGARKAARIDLLSYIGVYRERWEAVFWLVKTMLEGCPPYSILQQQAEKLPVALWNTRGCTIDETTSDHIRVKLPHPSSHLSLDDFVGRDSPSTMGVSAHRQVLGELWQGLGCMILQAEDLTASNPNRGIIMSHVLQILAHMHHSGILSDSIYNYESTGDKLLTRRPPTLYLLSSRILSVLSDVAWKSHWAGEMEKAISYGYELPPPRVQPQLPYVGSEVWLELVLWSSIEGGWVTEAAWLVGEIERRRPNPELQWSVISWEEVSTAERPQLTLTAIVKMQIDRARLNQATGINIANRGSLRSIEMGARTISCEVVLAIMDGLVNTATVDSHLYGNTLGKVRHHLSSCKSLLESGRPELDPGQLNALILRAYESSAVDSRQQPDHLRSLLRILPNKARPRDYKPPDSSFSSNNVDFSAAVLGLQHRCLDGFARQENLSGSLQVLRSIQDIIDANRDIYIQEFADGLKDWLARGSESPDITIDRDQRNVPMLYPEIPPYAVEAVLNLLVETKNFELGKWLLFNEDVDGGVMSPNIYSEISLQPSLLRFATATADDHLLLRVLENLQAPLSESILHALLGCQVSLNKWNAVEGILKHFRDTDGMAWAIADAMRIAAAIVALELRDGHLSGDQLLQARGVLQDLVQGEFNSPRNQAQVPDLRELRRANQLGRMFQSVAGSLSTMSLGPKGYLGRGAYSISIPPADFSILLDSVVTYHGPVAGQVLWEQWCSGWNMSSLSKISIAMSENNGGDRVVQPTASMLRLVLRPVIEDLKQAIRPLSPASKTGKSRAYQGDVLSDSSDPIISNEQLERLKADKLISKESLSIFNWGMNMCRNLGFAEDKIFAEVPASLRHLVNRA